jgi:hypothetical protein
MFRFLSKHGILWIETSLPGWNHAMNKKDSGLGQAGLDEGNAEKE